eukprot:g5242.t1
MRPARSSVIRRRNSASVVRGAADCVCFAAISRSIRTCSGSAAEAIAEEATTEIAAIGFDADVGNKVGHANDANSFFAGLVFDFGKLFTDLDADFAFLFCRGFIRIEDTSPNEELVVGRQTETGANAFVVDSVADDAAGGGNFSINHVAVAFAVFIEIEEANECERLSGSGGPQRRVNRVAGANRVVDVVIENACFGDVVAGDAGDFDRPFYVFATTTDTMMRCGVHAEVQTIRQAVGGAEVDPDEFGAVVDFANDTVGPFEADLADFVDFTLFSGDGVVQALNLFVEQCDFVRVGFALGVETGFQLPFEGGEPVDFALFRGDGFFGVFLDFQNAKFFFRQVVLQFVAGGFGLGAGGDGGVFQFGQLGDRFVLVFTNPVVGHLHQHQILADVARTIEPVFVVPFVAGVKSENAVVVGLNRGDRSRLVFVVEGRTGGIADLADDAAGDVGSRVVVRFGFGGFRIGGGRGFFLLGGFHVMEMDLDGNLELAMFREIQWDTFGTTIEHIDLLRVNRNERVIVDVPVELRGIAPGTHSGGVLDQQMRSLSIECPAFAIPDSVSVRIGTLEIGDEIKVSEVEVAEGLVIQDEPELTVVQVVEPVEELPEDEEDMGGPAEPEVIGRDKEDSEDES